MAHLIAGIIEDRELIHIQSTVVVRQAVELMASKYIGALVIKDEDTVLGIVSERDIARQVVAKGLDADIITVADIVHADATVLDKNEVIETAMRAISNTKRRHILVSDNGEVINIVSIGDLMLHVLEEKTETIKHLENYIYS